MGVYIPDGYQPIRDWLAEEIKRRGVGKDRTEQQVFWQAFEDLANRLAQDSARSKKLALLLTDRGLDYELPVYEWRQPSSKRNKIALDDRYYIVAPGSSVVVGGRVVVRSDFRCSGSAPTTPAASVTEATKPLKRGPTPIWDWEKGISDCWAHIYANGHSDLKRQAAIVRLLLEKMTTDSGQAPSESEAKKRAKKIWNSLNRDE